MTDVDKPLALKEREIIGKGLASLRSEGLVPAVLYNHGDQSLHVVVPAVEFAKIFHEAGKHHPLNLVVGSKKFLALVKDVQFNPVNRQMVHVVFQAIRTDEAVEAEIPVHLVGDSPAVKSGLIILHQLDTVEIEALPKDLPDEFTVDATKLVELHDKLTVEDIVVPAGVKILTEPDHPIATVAEPRAVAAEEAAEEEAEEAAAEGEVAEGEEAAKPEESKE